MEFQSELKLRQKMAEDIVLSFLPKEEGLHKTIFSAMNYSVKSPGKRLRPLIMMETYKMFGGQLPSRELQHFMAALEFIHSYSLVHDDLPAMDNDDYRRGRKTTHVVYGEAMGILAGDALLHYAFETAANAFYPECDYVKVAQALQILTVKSGVNGMVGGQVVDVELEGTDLSYDQLDFIYRLKTAALLECAMMIGGVLSYANPEEVTQLEAIARAVGVAFQIQDDILDITSTTQELGKPVGSDAKNHKVTYAVLAGIEKAQKQVEQLSDQAIQSLHELHRDDEFLTELLVSLIHRKK